VPILFTATQSGSPALLNLTVTPTGPSTANLTFTAPTLPLGQVTHTVINLVITATNAAGVTSSPQLTTVTIAPLPDTIAVTSAQYTTAKNKLRFDLTATSSVVSPNVVLVLQPYLTIQGTTFDPANLGSVFTNTGGGLYTLTLVGAPEPAVPPATPITVTSNLNGVSPAVSIVVRK
jgi:hypothetical protein